MTCDCYLKEVYPLKKLGFLIATLCLSIGITACSSDTLDPEEVIIEAITKATSGDHTTMMQVSSLVYNMDARPELIKTQVEHYFRHKEKGEVTKENVTLYIGEHPNKPQTDTYKHYIIHLPPKEAEKLKAKYAYFRAVNHLMGGLQVGVIQVDGNWYIDLAYDELNKSAAEAGNIDWEDDDVDWEELEHEVHISTFQYIYEILSGNHSYKKD